MIATGGLAQVVVPFVRETIDEVDDLLTLTGLRLIWERNAEAGAGAQAAARPAGPARRACAPRSRPG